MRRVIRVIPGTLFYLFLRNLIDLSFQIQDMYSYASFLLLLFFHWIYIRNFFLDFFSFFLIFMGEIAFTSILAVTFLCESAIWNNRMGFLFMNSYFSHVIFIWFHGNFVKFRYFFILRLIIFYLSYSLNLWYSLNYLFPAYSKILTPPIFDGNLRSFNYFVGPILGFSFITNLFVATFHFTTYLRFLFH